MTWCTGRTVGKWNDKAGDTIACRAYHASFPSAANAALHCPHAGKSGGGVCVTKSTFKCKRNYAGCLTYTDMTASGGTILFGGATGFAYSPKCIKIKAGQTITFKGDFSFHPLKAFCEETTTIPNTTSGTTKAIKFTKAGYYNYYCTNHAAPNGSGMAGNIWVVK